MVRWWDAIPSLALLVRGWGKVSAASSAMCVLSGESINLAVLIFPVYETGKYCRTHSQGFRGA